MPRAARAAAGLRQEAGGVAVDWRKCYDGVNLAMLEEAAVALRAVPFDVVLVSNEPAAMILRHGIRRSTIEQHSFNKRCVS